MKIRKQRFWSEKEMTMIDEVIKQGLPHNQSVRELGDKLNDRSYHSINLKLSRMKQPNTKRTNPFFYSENTISAIKEALNTTETIEDIATRFAKSLDKSYTAVVAKVNDLSKSIPNRKKTKFSKVKPVNSLAKIRQKRVLQDKKETFVQQEPAEIGIEVPHGMTFEGKPKKIMLHSDHFRIYF